MVLKELISNSFYCWEGVVVLKELVLTVSMLGGSGDLERTDFFTVSMLGGCGSSERTDY